MEINNWLFFVIVLIAGISGVAIHAYGTLFVKPQIICLPTDPKIVTVTNERHDIIESSCNVQQCLKILQDAKTIKTAAVN